MRRELLLLREMRDAAVAIRDLVGGRSAEAVDADAIRRSALLWHFTVLGEAASRVPVDTQDAHPDVAWRAATRLRNRIVHGYWGIDVETLVATRLITDGRRGLRRSADDGAGCCRWRAVLAGATRYTSRTRILPIDASRPESSGSSTLVGLAFFASVRVTGG